MSGLLTAAEVADIFNVYPETVTEWCRDGLIPEAFKTPGGHWRIPAAAVDDMISRPGDPP